MSCGKLASQLSLGSRVSIDEATGRFITALPKIATALVAWQARSNHSGSVVCVSPLTDPQGVTYPGLTVQLEAKAPTAVESCLYLFTIFRLDQGKRTRAYQLEVIPAAKRGHNGPTGPIFGPHEHFGEEAFAVVDDEVNCGDWLAAYIWFCRRCTLTAPTIASPC